MEKLIDNLENT
jgi:hypothetical protein